ncbi:MAG: beta-ketoacyl-[acyl-carrier-protein] synthase II, partial [Actinobacteria bacterium]
MKRVVITGIGPVTALGKDKDSFFASLLAGKSGINKIESFDVSRYSCQIASTIKDFDPVNYMDQKAAKRMDKFSQYAIAAAKTAIEDASLEINEDNQYQVGVIVGSGIGGLLTLENQHKVLLSKGPSRISPFLIP